jgi:hypothetical protein
VVRRAIDRGELSADVDAELLIDLVVGALWNRLLITRATLREGLPGEIVRMVLDGVRPR